MTDSLPRVQLPAEFKVSLDFYWQSIAMYAITLLLYIVVKALWDSTLQQGIVNVVLKDPVVVLLGAFVLISTISLVINSISGRTIIVADDSITFMSRFHKRTFGGEEIAKITLGRERRTSVRGMFSVVRIYVKGRRRALRIRPAVYGDEQGLVSALLMLRQHGATK